MAPPSSVLLPCLPCVVPAHSMQSGRAPTRREQREAFARGPGERVTVWDFCRGADVAAAVALLSEARARGQRAAPRAPASTAAALAAALDAPPAGVALALDAAANCSSATRQTPLHAAVSCTYTLLITPAMHVQRIRVRADGEQVVRVERLEEFGRALHPVQQDAAGEVALAARLVAQLPRQDCGVVSVRNAHSRYQR